MKLTLIFLCLSVFLVCVVLSRGDRYDALRACIGDTLCRKLQNLNIFLVSGNNDENKQYSQTAIVRHINLLKEYHF